MLKTKETLGFQESGKKIIIYAKNKGDPGFPRIKWENSYLCYEQGRTWVSKNQVRKYLSMLRTRETLGFQDSGQKIVIYAKNMGEPGFPRIR